VKEWGKQINLPLMDEVMLHYLAKRREVGLLEEAKALPAVEQAIPLTDEDYAEWLQHAIAGIKGGTAIVDLTPPELYDYLERRGEITVPIEENYDYLQKAVAWRAAELQKYWQEDGSTNNYRALQSFRAMREQGYFEGPEIDRLKSIAKKLLFFDYVQKNY
jgi:hypothetical protein